ncbi:hypothetical protein Tco_0569414 [Tanacetum coccineum]
MPYRILILDGRSLSLLNVFPDKHLLMIAPNVLQEGSILRLLLIILNMSSDGTNFSSRAAFEICLAS